MGLAEPDRADLGLFGPDSVTWRVHAEPILWLAALRALFLQMLLPRAIAGVVQNSAFREDPWGRLFRTAQFFGQVIYGDVATAQAAGARVRRRHARMRGVDPVTGAGFHIDEQELLRWVHVTAAESFCSTARRGGLRLTDAEVDQYYAEQLAVAELVGLATETVPVTAREVEAYYRQMRPRLRLSPDAAAAARFLALPTFPWGLGFTPVRPLWIGVAAYGFSLLPPWARRLYGLPGLPSTDLAATLTSRSVRLALRALPTRLLEGPIYQNAMARAERAFSMTRNTGESATIPSARAAGMRRPRVDRPPRR
ncbi:MAG: oxygenase MpaB family protein [Micromonosporaceae bacterium]